MDLPDETYLMIAEAAGSTSLFCSAKDILRTTDYNAMLCMTMKAYKVTTHEGLFDNIITRNHVDLCRVIFNRNPKLEVPKFGEHLIYSAFQGNAQMVELLLEHGIRTDCLAFDIMSETLWNAAYGGHTHVCNLLHQCAQHMSTEDRWFILDEIISNVQYGMDPNHMVISTLNNSYFEGPLQEYLNN